MPTTINQVIDVTIFRVETTTTAFARPRADRSVAAHRCPIHAVRGKCHHTAWWAAPGTASASAYSSPRRTTTQAQTTRTTHSTKRACQCVDPRKREATPAGEPSRGNGVDEGGAASVPVPPERAASPGAPRPARWRTTIRATIPSRPPQAKNSTTHSQGAK